MERSEYRTQQFDGVREEKATLYRLKVKPGGVANRDATVGKWIVITPAEFEDIVTLLTDREAAVIVGDPRDIVNWGGTK